jgi:hypothetical protein
MQLLIILNLVLVAIVVMQFRAGRRRDARENTLLAAVAEVSQHAKAQGAALDDMFREDKATRAAMASKADGKYAEMVARVRAEGDRAIAGVQVHADRVIAALSDKIGGSRGL